VVTETSGSTVRTTTTTHDAAGRVTRGSVAVTPASAGGTAVPDTVTGYDATTGLEVTSTAGTATVTTTYDTLGREVSQTDADGNTATVSYDADGRVKTRTDGKGTYTYTYDGTDSAGNAERRGLPTAVDTGAGVFTGGYDADGRLVSQTYPNGLVSTKVYDNDGQDVSLAYAKGGTTWLDFTRTTDVHGQTVAASSPASSQNYTYDGAGRLTRAEDAYAETCTTRVYTLSANSDRTALAVHPGTEPSVDADPVCTTATTAVTESHTYDAASRITDSGYVYDTLGRTTTAPAADVTGGAALTVGYYATDMVASLTQNGVAKAFTLDPAGRLRTVAVTGASVNGTVVNHYGDGSDAPAWITEADGSWTRNVEDLAGNLAAVQTGAGVVTLQLPNPHGDIVATAEAATTATAISGYTEQTEFGEAREDGVTARYGWLGAKQRSSDAVAGLVLMGMRLYNPATGRFLSIDPVPGGSDNAYEYCGADPIGCTDLDGTKKYKRYKQFQCSGLFASVCRGIRKVDVTALGYATKKTAQAGGATCRKKYGMTACWKSPKWMYERGGTVIATVFLTGSKSKITKDLMRHEKEHRTQWFIFGLDFSWIYLLEPTRACKNYFEIMAGLKDGGYPKC
jgi:RHS repeat-associated protein